jgi:hypothetical protein
MEIKDWNKARFEAIATLAMNGILANPATGGLSAKDIAKKAVENAKALDAELAADVPTPTVEELD